MLLPSYPKCFTAAWCHILEAGIRRVSVRTQPKASGRDFPAGSCPSATGQPRTVPSDACVCLSHLSLLSRTRGRRASHMVNAACQDDVVVTNKDVKPNYLPAGERPGGRRYLCLQL